MMTIFLESPDTAEVSASRVVTVVVEPPTPPVVLHDKRTDTRKKGRTKLRSVYDACT